MGRSWTGFLPQNELVKLQWAAVEACCSALTVEALRNLAPRAESEDEWEADESLPPVAPGILGRSQ